VAASELEEQAGAPYATGGGGVVLEHRYGAGLLASLLTGDPVPELGSDVRPLSVRFQASTVSPVDDLVVSGCAPDGTLRKVSIGVRRAPRLVASDTASVHLLASYLRVVIASWGEARAGRWRLALAVASPNPAVRQVRDLAEIAMGSPDAAAFRTEVARPRRTSQPTRDRLPHLDALVQKALDDADEAIDAQGITAAELTWRVLWSLGIRELRLEGADQTDRTFTVSKLRPVTRDGAAEAADALLNRLEGLSDGYAPAGATVTEVLLRRDLSGTPLARSPNYGQAWRVLDGLAGRLRDRSRPRLADTTGELSLNRADASQELAAAMTEAGAGQGALVILGEPDVGKSVLTVKAGDQVGDAEAVVTLLSLRDLPAMAVELESLLGGSLTDVLGATATGKARLLVIDGAEAVLEGRGQLLSELAAAAFRTGLGIAVVTRSDAAAAARQALATAMATVGMAGQVRDHEVPRLTSAEAGEIVAAFRSLTRVGLEPRAAWLLGRPGLVDLLLRAGAGAALPEGPLSEADVFAVVWRMLVRRDEVTLPGGPSPDAREQALLALAHRKLMPDSTGERPDAAALPSLRSDGLLLSAGPTQAWQPGDEFASDLIRDLAVARLLISAGWALLVQAAGPRWALRASRLACQATLASAQVGTEARTDIQAVFDGLAAEHGPRWAEVPLEAMLTLGTASEALSRAWPDLLAGDRAGLRTVLRLALQRYAVYGVGDAAVLEPLVALGYCGTSDLGQDDRHDRGVGKQVRKLVLAWLRGVILSGSGPLALRQQVRDRIISTRPEPYDEFAVEALATLGPDLDDQARAFLQGLAEAGGGHLAAAVESAGAARAMAEHQPDLLLALTERYYILPVEPDGSFGFFDGIRSHQRFHSPMAAWYYGPFHLLLKYKPAEALALINRMLDHAALVRADAWPGTHAPDGTAAEPPGLDLDLPGAGARRCAGDAETWRWHRGGSTAPMPCLSALLAVERFADELLDTWHLPVSDVIMPLLRECRNLAMPGLTAGLLIRHPELTGNLLDGWLGQPELWFMEAARVAAEGLMHIQGPDPASLHGREQRRWGFSDIAVAMTAGAVADGDQPRQAVLAAVADGLLSRAAAAVPDGGDDEQPVLVKGWAALLRADNYHLSTLGGRVAVEFVPPDDVARSVEAYQRESARPATAWRLQTTYASALDRVVPADTVADDLAAARDLAENFPESGGPVRLVEPVAAVAAAAIISHADSRAQIAVDGLRWSASVLTEVAAPSSAQQAALSMAESINLAGADRSAAAALPALLLPTFDNTGLDCGAIEEAIAGCAVRPADEVRMILARAAARVWAAACGPAGISKACRHRVLWNAILLGLGDCQLGGWDQAAQRRRIDPVREPNAQAIPRVETGRLLLNRLTAPLIAAADAAGSSSCIQEDAKITLDVILAAHRRVAIPWTEKRYRHPGDRHGPAVASVLAEVAASGNSMPLAEHVQAFTTSLQTLIELLRDLRLAFTYNDDLRPALPEVWRTVMQTALDELDAHPERLSDWQHRGRMLGGLIPAPDIEVSELHVDDVLEHARNCWPAPDVFADLISRWIPLARGASEPVGDLIQLIRCGTQAWQATNGLAWTEDLIKDHYQAAATAWFLTGWLQEVHEAGHLSGNTATQWRRIVDALAAEGNSAAVSLQQAEE
jgi:hypothetical protein